MSLFSNLSFLETELSQLSQLSSLGFQYQGCEDIPSNGAAGPSTAFFFSKDERTIEVAFFPSYKSEDECVLIYLGNKMSGAEINLLDWIKLHKSHYRDQFDFPEYAGGFNERVKTLASKLNEVFSDPKLVALLSGREWKDIPFDWGGLK